MKTWSQPCDTLFVVKMGNLQRFRWTKLLTVLIVQITAVVGKSRISHLETHFHEPHSGNQWPVWRRDSSIKRRILVLSYWIDAGWSALQVVYLSFARIWSSTCTFDQPHGALSHNIIPAYCNGIKRVAMRELFSRVAFQSLKKSVETLFQTDWFWIIFDCFMTDFST